MIEIYLRSRQFREESGIFTQCPSRIYKMNIFLIFLIYKAETSDPHQINSNTNISQLHKTSRNNSNYKSYSSYLCARQATI